MGKLLRCLWGPCFVGLRVLTLRVLTLRVVTLRVLTLKGLLRLGAFVVMAFLCGACVRVVTDHPTYYRLRYLHQAAGVHHIAVDRVKGGYCTRGRDRQGRRVYSAICTRKLATLRDGVARSERLFSHEDDIVGEALRLVQAKCVGVVYRVEGSLELPLEDRANNLAQGGLRLLSYRCGGTHEEIADSPFSDGEIGEATASADDAPSKKVAPARVTPARVAPARAASGEAQKVNEPRQPAGKK